MVAVWMGNEPVVDMATQGMHKIRQISLIYSWAAAAVDPRATAVTAAVKDRDAAGWTLNDVRVPVQRERNLPERGVGRWWDWSGRGRTSLQRGDLTSCQHMIIDRHVVDVAFPEPSG